MATAAGRKSMSRILLSSFRGTYNELRPMAEGDFSLPLSLAAFIWPMDKFFRSPAYLPTIKIPRS